MYYKKLFGLAVPNIISNITIPLVGMADLAVVGLLGSDTSLSAIAIGTAVFNMLYYMLAFLRMGSSGLTAQGYGSRNFTEAAMVLLRGVGLSLLLSFVILLFQSYIEEWSMWFMDGSRGVEQEAISYFRVRVWAAPATLALYVFQGWFIGMQNARTPMWVALIINVVNIAVSYLFAIVFGYGLDGVAYGTLLAQWVGVLLSVGIVCFYYGRVFRGVGRRWREIFDGEKLREFFALSGDIFIRTLCLVAVFAYFTKASSSQGDVLLAANTLLMQLFTFFSYFMDGFAYASESLAGRYYGAGNREGLKGVVRAVFRIGGVMALIFSVLYMGFGDSILMLFTRSDAILATARDYIVWAASVPLFGFAAFLWDGIIVGMTLSHILRNSMVISTALFFGLYALLFSHYGNEALWISFLLFLGMRGLLQSILTRRYIR